MSVLRTKPYFTAAEPARPEARRLLLLSYHFPPSTAVGALRWLKMSGHAAASAWAFDVIAADPASLKQSDETLLGELPAGTRVFGIRPSPYPLDILWARLSARWRRRKGSSSGTPSVPRQGAATHNGSLTRSEVRWFPPTLTRLRRLYNSWAAYAGDREWARRALKLAMDLVSPAAGEQPYAAIITCGPPHMVHLAGAEIAQRTGLPHVVDLRDPWSLVERLPASALSPLSFLLAERDERRVLDRAAIVIANTAPAAAALRERYPQHGDRIVVIMNGYDDEAVVTGLPRDRFVICYAGSIYLDRDPRPLFAATANLAATLQLTPQQFGLEFIGHVRAFEGVPLEEIAREEGVSDFLIVRPRMQRRQLLTHLSNASMLVILPQDSAMAIPAKAFEYMMFEAWLLVLAGRDTATAQLFAGLDADVVDPSDTEGITAAIRRRYEAHVAGRRAVRLAADGRYSRRRQTEILLSLLEREVEGRAAAAPAARSFTA